MGTIPNHIASTVFVDNRMAIERSAADVAGAARDKQLDETLISNVQLFRTYGPSPVRDLLRLIRKKHHHFDELPSEFRISIGSNQDLLLNYFEARFHRLIMHCFNICRQLLAADDRFATKYAIVPIVRSCSRKVALPEHPKIPLSISPCADKSKWTRRADASLRKRCPNLVRCVFDPHFEPGFAAIGM
jgi:hypothetical protein